ncbi:hypothetical protein AADZ84_15725 [Colwelliaceae bacterium MEBiC 14330]
MLKILSILILFSGIANAANIGTGSVKVTKMENWVGDSTVFIKTNQSELTNPAGCTVTDKYHLPTSASDISRSMLLSAYHADKAINIVIAGGACMNNRPQIVAISFQN